ncbi:MAG: 3-hydroxyacyl-ACP dehydratase FabZ family protein [Gemmataceae bacterium]
MAPPAILDISTVDLTRVLADKAKLRTVLPQRFEMEQIDAIVVCNREEGIVIGYKDVSGDEFWAKGHMPGMPIFPGVLICESAAQICSFHALTETVIGGDFVAFGGMENVRFRAMVRPGDRLVMVAKAGKINRRQMNYAVQGFVGQTLVFHGDIIGMAVNRTTADKPTSAPTL